MEVESDTTDELLLLDMPRQCSSSVGLCNLQHTTKLTELQDYKAIPGGGSHDCPRPFSGNKNYVQCA